MTGKIKSDGGSSDYYKLEIVNRKTGETFSCEMGDIIYSVYGNDFDMGNIAKAMRRIHCDRNGVGKEGADSLYDAKKIAWFAETLQQVAKFEHCSATEKELAPSVFRSILNQEPIPTERFVADGDGFIDTHNGKWYPDCSGEWVETDGLDFETTMPDMYQTPIEVIAQHERGSKKYVRTVKTTDSWFDEHSDWGNRVAYKIVKD